MRLKIILDFRSMRPDLLLPKQFIWLVQWSGYVCLLGRTPNCHFPEDRIHASTSQFIDKWNKDNSDDPSTCIQPNLSSNQFKQNRIARWEFTSTAMRFESRQHQTCHMNHLNYHRMVQAWSLTFYIHQESNVWNRWKKRIEEPGREEKRRPIACEKQWSDG